MENKKNIIVEKSFDLALRIIDLYKKLVRTHEFVLSKQVLRSGTSIGANVEEALAAHSKKDFVARMIISHKEARETRYWLRLIERSKLINEDVTPYLNEVSDVIHILSAIISTSKKNLGIPVKLFLFFFNIYLLIHPSFSFQNSILNS